MAEVSTSILSVKEEYYLKTFYNLEVAGTDYYHIDVMDGKFVENNTEEIMFKYASHIKQISNLPLDVHLMVEDIKSDIDKYVSLSPSIITFHYEACKNKEEVYNYINYIKQNDIKPGVSIKPNTDIKEILEFLPYIHMCLIMTVEPGKGGQALITETIEKIKNLKAYIEENNLDTYIEADGGINKDTVENVKEAGVDIIVAGSAIINAEDYKEAIQELKK